MIWLLKFKLCNRRMDVDICDIKDSFHDQTDKEDDIGFLRRYFENSSVIKYNKRKENI